MLFNARPSWGGQRLVHRRRVSRQWCLRQYPGLRVMVSNVRLLGGITDIARPPPPCTVSVCPLRRTLAHRRRRHPHPGTDASAIRGTRPRARRYGDMRTRRATILPVWVRHQRCVLLLCLFVCCLSRRLGFSGQENGGDACGLVCFCSGNHARCFPSRRGHDDSRLELEHRPGVVLLVCRLSDEPSYRWVRKLPNQAGSVVAHAIFAIAQGLRSCERLSSGLRRGRPRVPSTHCCQRRGQEISRNRGADTRPSTSTPDRSGGTTSSTASTSYS
ncbi:hypothetical protein C8Q80DRAFT_17774 [Daedaleopsis nitida]|nr:hypothetical protein C8Q80DRAFT_17774 [Daedaleopsis nitida]